MSQHKSPASGTETRPEAGAAKLPYMRPSLTLYGSVRELTGSGSGGDSDGGMPMAPAASDRALKENIVRVGQHPLGMGLYLFDYKPEFQATCGVGRKFGVMADEVELVVPAAVSVGENGYKAVNYAMLGITLN